MDFALKADFIFLQGDWLSFKRAQAALESVSNGGSSRERLEGMIPVMADFHIQMELIKIIWKVFYRSDSSRDIGSLVSCKNILHNTHVSNSAKEFYHNSEFMEVITKAYTTMGE